MRGDSKRIPSKNIRPIAGRPLAYWVCQAAKACRSLDEVYVSTEDPGIRQVVDSFHLGITLMERPKELATDDASTDSVMLDFAAKVDFEVLATIQATSPLLLPEDLDRAMDQFFAGGYDSLLTGVPLKRFVWGRDARPLNYDILHRPFMQDFAGSVVENGAFYLTRREILASHRNRLGGKIGLYVMKPESARELDEPDDWPVVERLLLRSRRSLRDRLERLKIIFSDVDGVWTDNTLYLDAWGRETLRFSKEDSLGLALFREKWDVPMVAVSKETNGIVGERCRKLGLPVLQGVEDKATAVSEELAKHRLSWSEACYIGNDLNDSECLARAGLSFCPADAVWEVRSQVHYVLSRSGGNGAIREMLGLWGDRTSRER